jgi:hypothetical protein
MRFLADMGVSQQVVEWLRTNGHDAVHLRDEGLQRLPNGDIFQKAGREQRIVLTFDLDFGEILAASGGQIVSATPASTRRRITTSALRHGRTPVPPPYCRWYGMPTYDVCPCCGFEFGFDDEPGTAPSVSFEEYLQQWIAEGGRWFDESRRPSGWLLGDQIAAAGIANPT